MFDSDAINLGFSRKALVYDAYGAEHPAIQWTRGVVRAHVLSLCEKTDSPLPVRGGLGMKAKLLELNAGTGDDAAYFAERGLHVHATDLADGMVTEIRRKIEMRGLHGALSVQQLSFTELERVTGGPYDLVFSNFGGLNCIPDLRPVAEKLPLVLRPGGYVVWVIMPPICLWELAQALRGRFRVAFRRLRRHTRAHVEGAYFSTFYFLPSEVKQALGKAFSIISLQSLSLFSPPAFMDGFPRRFPRLFRWLTQLDARVTRWPVLSSVGDFFMLTARYEGGEGEPLRLSAFSPTQRFSVPKDGRRTGRTA
ncbi:MAG: class I SAM-dependent methyltransferase [Anaerolineales bacterium]|nr:class I SAM-dependent methyltransferase [Anaerolineales bacterium]